MTTQDAQAVLAQVQQEAAVCLKCPLSRTRTCAVPGEGASSAKVLLIGEGPGKHEDLQGRPFVGAAGRVLNELLESIQMRREDIFISNVVKCRPPQNRDPRPDEVEACWPYLERQVAALNPKLVVLLGRHAMDRFLPNQRISHDHGKAKRRSIKGLGTRVYFPVYHPAAALYNPKLLEALRADFAKIPPLLKKIDVADETV